MVKSVGVTGTRERLTAAQEHAFFHEIIQQIRAGATEVHHGACVNADQFVHYHMISQPGIWTHVHPPVDPKFSAFNDLMRHARRIDHEALPYGERNQVIVDSCDVLIAAPLYPEEDTRSKRSGTWQTVRKGRAAGKLVIIVDREGKVKVDHEQGKDSP